MALDVANLRVAVDTTDLQDGKVALDQFTVAGGKAEASTTKLTAAAKAAGGSGGGLRMMSMQLSQVAQQGAATGNYLQALAIQAPDLALGFGAIGIAAGAAIPILYGLAQGFIDTGQDAAEMDKSFERLGSRIDGLEAVFANASLSMDDLVERFGELADEMQLAFDVMERMEMRSVEEGFRNLTADVVDQIGLVDTLTQSLRGFTGERAQVEALASTFGMTAGEAYNLLENLNAIEQADSIGQAAERAADLLFILEETEGPIYDLESPLGVLIARLTQLVSLAGDFNEQMSQASSGVSGPDGARSQVQDEYFGSSGLRRDDIVAQWTWSARTPRKSGGRGGSGGGGGMSQAQKDHNERLREAERIYESTRTAAERYAEEVEDLQELLDLGYLSEETYARAVADVKEQFEEATSAADEFSEINGLLKDSILDFAENGESAMDSLASAIKRAALEALLFGEGPLGGVLGDLFGGSTGLLGGLFGGARADGGPVSGGKTYLVGERGPELFTPGASGMITPNEQLGGGGGKVDVAISMSDGGYFVPVVQRVAGNVVARAAPAIMSAQDRKTEANLENYMKRLG